MNLRDALLAVYDQHERLTPELVVEEARKADTDAGRLLHGRLEWDDAVAGEAYRRHQAHELIQTVRVTYAGTDRDPETSVRAFHSVRTEHGYGFVPVGEVIEDPFTTRLVLAEMEREWRALLARYEGFKEFVQMVRRDLDAA